MTKFLQPSFSVNLGSPEYSKNWNSVFGQSDGSVDVDVDDGPITERNPRSLTEYQKAQGEWAALNFPGPRESWQPLLGVVEEVGELCHAHLKNVQGIRGTKEEWELQKRDAVGDILIYLLDYCSREGLDVNACLAGAWDEVSKRDWVAFPKNGVTE